MLLPFAAAAFQKLEILLTILRNLTEPSVLNVEHASELGFSVIANVS